MTTPPTLSGRYVPSYSVPVNRTIGNYDIFNASFLRYLGYADEFTMATRTLPGVTKLPYWNPLGWGIGITYALTHAYQRAMLKTMDSVLLMKDSPNIARKKSDVALFKTLGLHVVSACVGPLLVEGVKRTTSLLLRKAGKPVRQWPVIAGLATIPVIHKLVNPAIQENVDKVAKRIYLRIDENYIL